jgi:hypothetical protein
MSFETDLNEVLIEAPEKPRLALVPPPVEVPPLFEPHRAHLEQALEGTFHTLQDVVQAVASGRAQFWPGKQAAMVTEIDTISETKVLRVWIAGGDMEELKAMAPGIESWARLNECREVLVEGRKGWERALKDQGYSPWLVTIRKAL